MREVMTNTQCPYSVLYGQPTDSCLPYVVPAVPESICGASIIYWKFNCEYIGTGRGMHADPPSSSSRPLGFLLIKSRALLFPSASDICLKGLVKSPISPAVIPIHILYSRSSPISFIRRPGSVQTKKKPNFHHTQYIGQTQYLFVSFALTAFDICQGWSKTDNCDLHIEGAQTVGIFSPLPIFLFFSHWRRVDF